jgi:hypothetical protein
MTHTEALKLALKALEADELDMVNDGTGNMIFRKEQAITAIKEALAQPEQPEPPPWWPAVENILKEYGLQAIDFVADFKKALAQPEQEPWPEEPVGHIAGGVHPPQREWVGLTDKEIYEIGFDINVGGLQTMKAYKAIEAKLKAKNEHL